jgi:hypothetical protein
MVVSEIRSRSDALNFWMRTMTLRDIVEVLEGLTCRREDHALVFDRGTRQFLIRLLREHLPRSREVSPA